ncbi:sulfite exporter TauE/SafE family protein [Ancylobacter pratisalsi]|uniref:Probable membrane transporter protein n=1 Tax=Ancylobacter pratisalsi TaxID=1745854 RepID=A0A6P1YNJ3_9HYPH|nr:sulfite exporter TauE/SafE family protein [Ancylobacter pratisalsi]QIB34909.1 sulfite exporter TauE/SafE family protein [Ancylobacter pratisalsi]
MIDFAYIFSGFFVGILVGLTGVGGGSLMSPLLILLFGVAPTTAIGTDLWFAAVTKMFGSAFHHRYGSLNLRIAVLLGIGSIPSSVLVLLYLYVSHTTFDPSFTTNILGGVLLMTSVAMVFRERIQRAAIRGSERFAHLTTLRDGGTVLCGCVIGAMVTLTSVGAGALGAVFLIALYPTLAARQIAGTDTAHAVPLTIIAGTGYLILGNVDLALLGLLLLGSIPGIALGTLACSRLDERLVRILITLVLFVAGVKLLLR